MFCRSTSRRLRFPKPLPAEAADKANAKLEAHADFASIDFSVSAAATAAAGDAGIAFRPDDFAVFCASCDGDVKGQSRSGVGIPGGWTATRCGFHGGWTQRGLVFCGSGGLFRRVVRGGQPASVGIRHGRRQIDGGFSGFAHGTSADPEPPGTCPRGDDTAGATRAFGHGAAHIAQPAQSHSEALRVATTITEARCRWELAAGYGRSGSDAPGTRDYDQCESRDGDALFPALVRQQNRGTRWACVARLATRDAEGNCGRPRRSSESLSRWPRAQVLWFRFALGLHFRGSGGLSILLSYLFPLRHAGLIGQLARREVHTRYRQSWLGTAWLVLTPLLMLVVYTLVFRHVFQVRWSPPGEGNLAFALRLYAGLAVFNFFAECVNRAPLLIVEQPHLVKKVVFPVEVLPWASVMAALAHLGIAAVALLGLRWLGMGTVPLSALALPLVWLPLLPLCLGLGWGLSAVGTFIRDIGQILSMAMTALVFMSPVFFPVDALPGGLRDWMWLNPLAPIMTQTRTVLLEGQWPDWSLCSLSFVASLAVAWAGAALFRRLRPGFSDVV
jgi:lipopolysaccharide transport system permease protein